MTLHLIVTFRYTFPGGGCVRIGFRVIDQGKDIDRLTACAIDTARKWYSDPQSFDGPEASHLATFYVVDEEMLQTFDDLKFTEPHPVEHLGTLFIRGQLMQPSYRLMHLLATRLEEAA